MRRARRARATGRGTTERPRLSVFRSNRRLAVQLIDDQRGVTVASASDREPAAAKGKQPLARRERARRLGERIAELAEGQGIASARFDRGRYRYHGLIAAIAEGARSAGLEL
jgi:large subunit ribosomal protein L18